MIAKTAMGNTVDHVVPALESVYRTVYEQKRARRMCK